MINTEEKNNIQIINEPKEVIIETYNKYLKEYQKANKITHDMQLPDIIDFNTNTIDFKSSFTDKTCVFVSKNIDKDIITTNKKIMYAVLVTQENINNTYDARIFFDHSFKLLESLYQLRINGIIRYVHYITNYQDVTDAIDKIIVDNYDKQSQKYIEDISLTLSRIFNKEIKNYRNQYKIDDELSFVMYQTNVFRHDKNIMIGIVIKNAQSRKNTIIIRLFTQPTSIANMLITLINDGLVKAKCNADIIIKLMAVQSLLESEVNV